MITKLEINCKTTEEAKQLVKAFNIKGHNASILGIYNGSYLVSIIVYHSSRRVL